ncbi:MAG: hypothetical protein IPJ49_21010 [Candidatus Obscuribacter sp.]|nr:hypothetical protein [Candidatus Obscuribacter sp.]
MNTFSMAHAPAAFEVPQAKNFELGKLIRPSYTLDRPRSNSPGLVAHNTLKLRRYSSGGHSAVTVLDEKTFEAAVDGLLVFPLGPRQHHADAR